MLTLNHLVTSGTFSLDGGTWDVDNNVWVLGDDAECAHLGGRDGRPGAEPGPVRPVPEVRRAAAGHPAHPHLPGHAPRRRRPRSRRPGEIDAATATRDCAALRAFLTTATTTSSAHEKATGFLNDALVAYIQASLHEAGCPAASN